MPWESGNTGSNTRQNLHCAHASPTGGGSGGPCEAETLSTVTEVAFPGTDLRATLSATSDGVDFAIQGGEGWMAVGVTAAGTSGGGYMTSGGQGTDVYYCDASTNNVVWRTKATQYANPKSYAGKAEVPNSNCNVAAGTFSFQVNYLRI